jgi:hypothetical protein
MPVAGISDQEPGTFSDPLFAALGMTTARVIMPWNVLATEPERLDSWMAAVQAAGIEPMVALEHARGDRCPASPCGLPSVEAYATQLRALLARYPALHVITPWNEPNHGAQPTAGAPRRAAEYYDAARAACPECTLVAGDLLDASGMTAWLAEYRDALVEEPRVWGLHNYFDTTYERSAGLATLLAAVRGEIWLTETGGIVFHRLADGRPGLPPDERRASRAVAHALRLAAAHRDRVRRVYVYQWRAGPGASFDAGLLRSDGAPRPAYWLLRAALAPPATTTKPAAGRPAGTPPGLGPLELRGRRLRVPIRCASACSGRVSVESTAWRTSTLLNGHPRGTLVPPRAAPFAVAARGAVALTLPSTIRRHPVRVLVEAGTEDGTTVATVTLVPRRR